MGLALVKTPAAKAPFDNGQDLFEEFTSYLQSQEAQELNHSELEREMEKKGREILRALYQGYLDARGPGEAVEPVIDSDDVEHTRKREHTRDIETIFGTVSVSRTGYSTKDCESLHPLDAALNLPGERYSHELRRRVAEEASKSSFEETVSVISRTTGARIGKRQVEELAIRAAQDFDAFYAETELESDNGDSILIVSCDGKGVVMRHEDLREATQKAAKDHQNKMKTRLSRGEKRNRKRMATVAAVYTIAPHVRTPEDIVTKDQKRRRPRPEGKRVWASLEKTTEEVIGEVYQEANGRDPKHEKEWVALVDGAKPQIRLLKKMARENSVKLTIVADIVHVIEYLWKAGIVLHDEGTAELEAWVKQRLLEVLRGNASGVAAGMRRSATLREIDQDKRKPIDTCAGYLLGLKGHLDYDVYLAKGFPIATGVIEGTCRYLVKDRMDRTGARWSLQGGEAILRLRALRASGDFEEYWKYHEKEEYQRNHACVYAENTPTPVAVPIPKRKQPQLRRIK